MYIETKAEELFNWVLDMLENPTDNNTADEVCLFFSNYYNYGCIQVGYDVSKGITNKRFEWPVMERLAEIFESEDGYEAKFYPWTFRLPPRVEIRIRKQQF